MTAEQTLALYLVLDTSASMTGAPLAALVEGIEVVISSLESVFDEWETQCSMLQYASAVHAQARWVPLSRCKTLPILETGGTSALGAACHLLASWIEDDLPVPGIVFVFTDGPGTDEWEPEVDHLQAFRHRVLMVGIGCGPKADLSALAGCLDITLYLDRLNHGKEALDDTLRPYCARLQP